jgi:diguanylate cyclase (GGDEF)-like protein
MSTYSTDREKFAGALEARAALDAREKKLQTHRLRMNGMSIVNVLLESFILALYAWTGHVSWNIVLGFLIVSTGSSALFAAVIAMNWNLHLKDKGLLLPQLAFALATQLIFLVLAPQLAVVFLASILVFYNFAMMGFSQRQFLAAWLFYGVMTAGALYVSRERFNGTDAEMAILWLFFFLAIRQLSIIGAQFSRLRAQLSEKNRQLQAALKKNEDMASHDDLTDAYNRRHFMRMLVEERDRSNRTGQIFCVSIFDLDHFKLVNDQFGHQIGDRVLQDFCKVVRSAMRCTDHFARYGGEEFALVLAAATSLETAMRAVERIRDAVDKHDWDAVAPGLHVMVSCGVTAYRAAESVEELLARADQALYDAKNAGRNRVVLI